MTYIDHGAHIVFDKSRMYYWCGHDSTNKATYEEYNFQDIREVSSDKYFKAKLGSHINDPSLIDFQIAKHSDGSFLSVCYRKDNLVRLHDKYGKIIEVIKGVKSNAGLSIEDLPLDNNNIWIVSATEHFVGKFNLKGDQLFSFNHSGSFEPGIFNYPESIVSYGEFM